MLFLPQPFLDLEHTSDVGVRVRGASAGEALERLCLALSAILSGGNRVLCEGEEIVTVRGAGDLPSSAIALLRELLYLFASKRLIPGAVEVLSVDEEGATARVRFGPYDKELHREGADVKAVTFHLALLERDPSGVFIGQAVFDV